MNIRDWLFVDDHVDALLLAATRGKLGDSYCIGGSLLGQSGPTLSSERTNKYVVDAICSLLDRLLPDRPSHSRLIQPVADRPGHDRRYAIDATKMRTELGWSPSHDFDQGLEITVRWYLNNLAWCQTVLDRANYSGQRLGMTTQA